MPENEVTLYIEKLQEVVDVPAADELVQGNYTASEIKLAVEGTYRRGEVLMSSGGNAFVTATAAGLATATEVCILCCDCEVPASSYVFASGYFMGTFNPERLILSYETDSDDHAELIDAILVTLRRHGIFLN